MTQVDKPDHYGGRDCLDAMKLMLSAEEYRGFLRGNRFKYDWRYRQKGGIVDLMKSRWYGDELIEFERLLQENTDAGQS
jgi:hypothetical protein